MRLEGRFSPISLPVLCPSSANLDRLATSILLIYSGSLPRAEHRLSITSHFICRFQHNLFLRDHHQRADPSRIVAMIIWPLPTDNEIDAFEEAFLQQTYRFTNRDLIREALQGCGPANPNGNKILALAGDAILRQVLVDYGRDRQTTPGRKPFPNKYIICSLTVSIMAEDIQNTITRVASNINLYARGVALGLDPFIVKNPGQWGVMAGRNVMATTMEAIIGAVFYDSNKDREACERVMAALGLSWPE